MRIALVAAFPFPAPQGSQLLAARQAAALRAAGHEVELFCFGGGDGRAPGLPVHRTPSALAPRGWRSALSPWRAPADLALAAMLARAAARRPFDLTLAHHVEATLAARLVPRRRRGPLVYVAHTRLAEELAAYLPELPERARPWGRTRADAAERAGEAEATADPHTAGAPAARAGTVRERAVAHPSRTPSRPEVALDRAAAHADAALQRAAERGAAALEGAAPRVGHALDCAAARAADAVLALSPRGEAALRHLARGPVVCAPPPFEPGAPPPATAVRDACARHGLAPDRYAVYAGNLDRYQDLPLLDGAAALLPDLPCVAVVHDPRGVPLRHVQVAVVRTPEEARALVHGARLAVAPRRRAAGFPMKLLGYLEAVRPVVALEGAAGTLEHDRSAWLLREDAGPHALAAALRHVAGTPALAARLATGGCVLLAGAHAPATHVARILALVRPLLDTPRNEPLGARPAQGPGDARPAPGDAGRPAPFDARDA